MDNRRLVNAISLFRIPIGLGFVLVFREDELLFVLSIFLCLAAALTDVLDGFFARRRGIASVYGRQMDSLGDKAFYMAVVVAFLHNGLLGPILAWSLVTREIALYILRVLHIEKLPQLEEIRFYTNWHGYCMYALILLGLGEMYGRIHAQELELMFFIQLCAGGAVLFGIASIFKFLSLKTQP